MKRRLPRFVLGVCVLLALGVNSVSGVTVTVKVTASDGASGVPGVVIAYGAGGNPSSGYFGASPHKTDGNGQISADLSPGTYSFEARLNNGKAEQLNIVVAGPGSVVVPFSTYKLTVRLEECDTGNGLDGGNARYGPDGIHTTSWFPGGLTGSSAQGEAVAEFFPGDYSFEMQYQSTAQVKPLTMPAADTTLTWQASRVTLQYSGSLSYGGSVGDGTWFNKPTMYLLAGTYKFHAHGGTDGRFDLTIGGCSVTKSIILLMLKDHNGNPLAGGKARGGEGASYWTWWVPGTTDATDGALVDVRNGLKSTMSYEMQINWGREHKTQDVSVNSIFMFQTDLVVLRLEKCDGTGLAGGRARYGAGPWFFCAWWPGGPTDASGETEAEMLPGTYSFEMQYKGTADLRMLVDIPAGNPVVWKTTNVTMNWAKKVSYGGLFGDFHWFDKPSMELLPGKYVFHFRGVLWGRESLDIDPDDNPCTPFSYTYTP
ncbi:MAG: hypothetical protein JW955_22135 [Sedimentisphaerales bacterium]|nr:hypothetical protein [Sedimentisphaerales bacterium]